MMDNPPPPTPTKITEIRTLLDAWECKKRASNERSRAFLAFYSLWLRCRPLPGYSLTASLRLSRCDRWAGYRGRIHCDNLNSVLALQNRPCQERFHAVMCRDIHLITSRHDISPLPTHCDPYRSRVREDTVLQHPHNIHPPDTLFHLSNTL